MLKGKARYELLFGPYEPPRTREGKFLVCEMRGKVKVGSFSDGPIPWPRAWKTRSLILCGDLIEAVKRESSLGVAHQWGTSIKTVQGWRRTLGVETYNEGTQMLMKRQARENATPQHMRAMTKAARKVTRKPKSKAWRERMSVIIRERIRKRGSINPNLRLWTEKEEKLLGTKTDEVIGRLIGRTTSAVRARRRDLGIGLEVKGSRTWTANEDRLLRMGTKNDAEVAVMLGRGERGVEHRRQRLGIPSPGLKKPRKSWTKKEMRMLGKIADKEFARRFGRSLAAVRGVRHKLGIQQQAPEYRLWTAAEDKALRSGSHEEAAARLGRTLIAVAHRRRKLGIANPAANRRWWTAEEMSMLGKVADAEIAARTGFSIRQIRAKRGREGIRAPERFGTVRSKGD
jgi:hypothetical protein